MESPCPALKPNAKFDGGVFHKCLSDEDCQNYTDEGTKYHIFNHFDRSDNKLIPECRPNSAAKDQPGFTCGFDPMLKTGSRVVIKKIPAHPSSRFFDDPRKITLLGETRYDAMTADLLNIEKCKDDTSVSNCPTIDQFSKDDSCGPQDDPIVGGSDVIVFENPFNNDEFSGCKPKVISNEDTTGWTEERQIYIGYDDLIMFGVKLDSHKVYKLSCFINKHGKVNTDFDVKSEAQNVNGNDTLDTTFEIETYYDDINNQARPTEKLNEVIKLSPADSLADYNHLIQFKVTSNHESEYVHLKQCSLFHNDTVKFNNFIEDGCIAEKLKVFFDQDKIRKETEENEDWFFMRPIVMIDDCKTQWHIDCTVVSCSREHSTEVCEAGPTCTERYSASFLHSTPRKRRSALANSAETHVEADFFHPCYYVDQNAPEYCYPLNGEEICWTLEYCAKEFPNNFPNFQTPDLDSILTRHKFEVENYIEQVLGSRKLQIDEQKLQDIVVKAVDVDDAVSEIDDAVSEIVQSIRSLEDEIMDE